MRLTSNMFACLWAASGTRPRSEATDAGLDAEKLMAQVEPGAKKRIESRLVLENVAKAENITVDEADVEKEIARMAESYKVDVEKIKDYLGESGKKDVHNDLAIRKALDFVVENAKEA